MRFADRNKKSEEPAKTIIPLINSAQVFDQHFQRKIPPENISLTESSFQLVRLLINKITAALCGSNVQELRR